MTETIKPIIKDLLLKYRWMSYIEIEVRFGWYDKLSKKFNSDIGGEFYDLISEKLNSFDKWDQIMDNNTVDYYTKTGVRVTTNSKGVILDKCIKKKVYIQDVIINGSPYDVRISVCTEKPCVSNDNVFVYTRNKHRKSYTYKMWSYDLTHVETPIKYFKDRYKESNISYEFELELKNINADLDNDYLSESICMKIEDILNISKEKIHLRNVILV
jgi:hypothetical protein